MSDTWLVSTSEEWFTSEDYKSKEDAIKMGREELNLEDDEGFYVGKKESYVLPMPSAKEFFYDLVERNCDELGDWSEYWESSFKNRTELHEKVDQHLNAIQKLIMDEHKPDFYLVKDTEFIQ